jgi:hypothetical protein
LDTTSSSGTKKKPFDSSFYKLLLQQLKIVARMSQDGNGSQRQPKRCKFMGLFYRPIHSVKAALQKRRRRRSCKFTISVIF